MRFSVEVTYAELMVAQVAPAAVWLRDPAWNCGISADVDSRGKQKFGIVFQQLFYVKNAVRRITVTALCMKSAVRRTSNAINLL